VNGNVVADLGDASSSSARLRPVSPFHIDEAKKTLTHLMFVSLFPDWLGQTQTRVVKIEGDTLYPSSEKPKKTMSYLKWKRAEPI
jgi:hypothetical protein